MTLEYDELADPAVMITLKGVGTEQVTVMTPLKGLEYGDIARISRSEDPWGEVLPFVSGRSFMKGMSDPSNHARLLAATREQPLTALLYGTGANGLIMARLPLPGKNQMRELFLV